MTMMSVAIDVDRFKQLDFFKEVVAEEFPYSSDWIYDLLNQHTSLGVEVLGDELLFGLHAKQMRSEETLEDFRNRVSVALRRIGVYDRPEWI